jgi:4-hydroxybenzoate polyprenyltransferase
MRFRGEVKGPVVFDQVHLPTLLVPVGPFYIGWILASQRLLPTEASFYIALLSLMILGLGTVLVNDAHDITVDALSHRKARFATSTGRITGDRLKAIAASSFGAALMTATLVSVEFMVVIGLLVILALLYSVPPVQLSRRPGVDLTVNGFGIGVLCTIAGWVLVSPGSLPPIVWLVTSWFGTGTFFLLPALMDLDSDLEGGKVTVAVMIGWRRACHLGFILIGLADVGIVLMSLTSIILNPSFLYIAWPIILGQLLVFPILASRRDLLKPLTGAIGGLLFIGNLLIVLSYLDVLGPF